MPISILESLFNGSITPNKRDYIESPEYKAAQQVHERNRSKLSKQLDAELKEAFDKLCEAQGEMGYYERLQSFIDGFRLGMQLTIAGLGDKNSFGLDSDV